LPLFHCIADASKDTPRELDDRTRLASALYAAGNLSDSEARMWDILFGAGVKREYRTASTAARKLIEIVTLSGRLEEALDLIGLLEKTNQRDPPDALVQLADQSSRLKVESALGRDQEVWSEFTALRAEIKKTEAPSSSTQEVPWELCETILEIGRSTAINLEQWVQATELNDEIEKSMKARGAPEIILARSRLKNCRPLLRLGKVEEVSKLVSECRKVFEKENDWVSLGACFAALGDIDGSKGTLVPAISSLEKALRYQYFMRDPEFCAATHDKLSELILKKNESEEKKIGWAHFLAAALIRLRTGSQRLEAAVAQLARAIRGSGVDASPIPSGFDQVCELVERTEGVDFSELFAHLPTTHAASGEQAMKKILFLAYLNSPD
jgi:hypothetical protein